MLDILLRTSGYIWASQQGLPAAGGFDTVSRTSVEAADWVSCFTALLSSNFSESRLPLPLFLTAWVLSVAVHVFVESLHHQFVKHRAHGTALRLSTLCGRPF